MARSLIGGLVARGMPRRVRSGSPNRCAALRDALRRDFGVSAFADSRRGRRRCRDLGARGQAAGAARGLRSSSPIAAQRQQPLVVSIAAGITTAQLERWLGGDIGVVRAMPNTPALLGAGVTGLFANPHVDAGGRQLRRAPARRGRPNGLAGRRSADGRRHRGVRQRPGLCVPAGRSDDRRPRAAQGLPRRRRAHAGAADHPRRGAHADRRRCRAGRTAPPRHLAGRHHPGGDRSRSKPAACAHCVATAIHAARERGRELSAAND